MVLKAIQVSRLLLQNKTFEEILQEEATAAGIYQMNSDGGKPRQVQAQASPNNQTTSSTQTRTVAQRM